MSCLLDPTQFSGDVKVQPQNKNVYSSSTDTDHSTSLVDLDGLRQTLWSDQARPSRNWVRKMAKLGRIPVIEVGRRVFFDVEMVRNALNDEAERERLRRALLAR